MDELLDISSLSKHAQLSFIFKAANEAATYALHSKSYAQASESLTDEHLSKIGSYINKKKYDDSDFFSGAVFPVFAKNNPDFFLKERSFFFSYSKAPVDRIQAMKSFYILTEVNSTGEMINLSLNGSKVFSFDNIILPLDGSDIALSSDGLKIKLTKLNTIYTDENVTLHQIVAIPSL